MPYDYLSSVFSNLDTLESWRRDKLTPEERAAEDAAQRWRNARDAVGAVALVGVSLSLTVLPWAVGLWYLGSSVAGRFR